MRTKSTLKWDMLDQVDGQSLEKICALLADVKKSRAKLYAALMGQKGLNTLEQAQTWFSASFDHLHDPLLMKDMDSALARLRKAVAQQERILLYGDYDVDGTTAVALLLRTLGKHHQNLDYYISDRHKEGYGLSEQGMDYARSKETALMITLDCGIKAHEKIAKAKAWGMDLIVCDHHEPSYPLPVADAVLDIKRNDCNYPYKALSGCGVGFKLMQALYGAMDWPHEELEQVAELLAISIAADLVPMTGENRSLMKLGLKQLKERPSPGIAQLMALNQVEWQDPAAPITVNDVVFGIAPSINAAGRLEHARQAVEVLVCEEEDQAETKATALKALNEKRKTLDKEVTSEALALLEMEEGHENKRTTVVYSDRWHKGVVGIVASRLQETYYRPTIVFTSKEGLLTGSARSVENFDLLEALHECKEFMTKYGGHAFAAGLSLEVVLYENFKEHFEQVVAKRMEQGNYYGERLPINLVIDFVKMGLDPQDVHALASFVERMAPYGPENHQPIFLTENLRVAGLPKVLGAKGGGKHLKLEVYQEGMDYRLEAIGFGMADWAPKLENQTFSACYYLEYNYYRGRKNLQLRLKDIRTNGQQIG